MQIFDEISNLLRTRRYCHSNRLLSTHGYISSGDNDDKKISHIDLQSYCNE